MLINAAEIMRYTYQDNQYVKGWSEADTKSIEGMFRNVFLPVLTTLFKPNLMQMVIGEDRLTKW